MRTPLYIVGSFFGDMPMASSEFPQIYIYRYDIDIVCQVTARTAHLTATAVFQRLGAGSTLKLKCAMSFL